MVPVILPLGCRSELCVNNRMGWRSSCHAKYEGTCHLIWCPNRGWTLGDADVRAAVTGTYQAIAEEFGFWIEELAVEADHVHGVLEFPPKHSIARVVRILKSISASRTTWQFPDRARARSGQCRLHTRTEELRRIEISP